MREPKLDFCFKSKFRPEPEPNRISVVHELIHTKILPVYLIVGPEPDVSLGPISELKTSFVAGIISSSPESFLRPRPLSGCFTSFSLKRRKLNKVNFIVSLRSENLKATIRVCQMILPKVAKFHIL